MRSSLVLILACIVFGISNAAFSTEKIGSKLTAALAASSENDQIMAWVFFTDKGSHEYLRDAVPMNVVSERSLQRRRKVRAENELVDYTDLPVEQAYIDQLAQHVLWVKQRSKWFNAASVVATRAQIQEISNLPFVSSLELVYRARVNRELEREVPTPIEDSPLHNGGGNQLYDLNYGSSLNQNQQINVPAVHNAGNYAQGVIVGVFDNGVRLLSHQAFDTLRPRIVAKYDFVSHDPDPAPNPGDPSSYGSHGVSTLSIVGGYREGQLIGPAFGANYIIARTENDSSETPIEEDNWAAAIEWADSIGVDVTSTSLGYNTYDPPYTPWTWQDMNGNTTVITRAADAAVARGIVVCNSAGNDGNNPSHNTLGAPADGDSVLAIGALTSSGTRSSYSSVGPTTSIPPRSKPDIMAQGSSVWNASSSGTTSYGFNGSGTSYACPLAAGAAALVIKARLNATAIQVINALKSTASNASSPNNLIGWGTINVVAAINSIPATNVRENGTLPSDFHLEQNYPNPFNPSTSINYSLPEDAFVTVKVYDALGREVKTLISGHQTAESYRIVWNGTDASGRSVASGMYLYRIVATNASGKVFADSKRMMLLK